MTIWSSRTRANSLRAALIFVACTVTTACAPRPAQPAPSGALISPIKVTAISVPLDPNDPDHVKVGKLTYLAGFELTANDKRFGGLSGMVITPDGGELTLISDRGYWVDMRLVHDGDRLAGFGAARLGVLGGRTAPLLTKKESDSESLARDRDGSYLVGFEGIHRIWRYRPTPDRPGPDALSGTASKFPMPALLKRARSNQSLEDLTVLPDGQVLAALESPIPGEKNNHAWLVDRQGVARDLFYDAKDGYSPTDLTVLPDGDVMAVERYYRPLVGVRARFRIIKRADIVPGAHIDGTLIAEIKAPLTIDNMEGLAARKAPGGATLIYVVSDDNYSPLQRTLLMEFRLDR